MYNLVVRQENNIANGCFQKFSCEYRIGEGGATEGAWQDTEHRETRVGAGRAHQNYRLRPDGSGDNWRMGGILTEEPRTEDDFSLISCW